MSILLLLALISLTNGKLPIHSVPYLPGQSSQRTYETPTKFDPERNSTENLASAIEEAKHTQRNVLIEIGGEWCLWYHVMDSFYSKNPDLLALRDRNYVLLKADVSEGHPNSEFLSHFPQIDGVPHIFIVDSKGKLIRSEDTNELEEGDTYNLDRFRKFLEKYAPKKRGSINLFD
jgi:thiol:disulfide interchange protein